MGQPIVIFRCLQMCVSMQSLLVWIKVQSRHWYLFTPPGWLIHSGIASGGMATLTTTTVRNEAGFTERLGDGGLSGSGGDLDVWSDVGTMQHCFDGISVISLIDSTDEEEELVRPTMGTDVGGGAIQVVIYVWACCTFGVIRISDDCNLSDRRSMNLEAREPNKVTSSCCMASICKRSAIQWM